MDRVAVFIDAGYLFAQGSIALSGQRQQRSAVVLDHEKAVDSIESFSRSLSGLPLLRIYWYDGTSSGPTPQHLTLAHLPRVKVRLGFVNSVGEQKGVDSLIVTDMITLARNHAMADAVLLSGDEDLRVGVQQAQEFGVRVHLLGIRPGRGSQSLFLLQEADSTTEWGPDELKGFLSIRTQATAEATTQPSASSETQPEISLVLQQVAEELAREVPPSSLADVVESIRRQGLTPREFDARMLAKSRARTGIELDSAQKRQLRAAFLLACEQRLAET